MSSSRTAKATAFWLLRRCPLKNGNSSFVVSRESRPDSVRVWIRFDHLCVTDDEVGRLLLSLSTNTPIVEGQVRLRRPAPMELVTNVKPRSIGQLSRECWVVQNLLNSPDNVFRTVDQ